MNKRNKVETAILAARQLHRNGQLSQAMAAYQKILRSAPSQPDALHYLGLAYYQNGHGDVAISYLKRAIAAAPRYVDAMNNLANIYKETERLPEARALYSQVLCIAPEHVNALVNSAVLLRSEKQPADALQFAQRAVLLQPEHAVAQHTLGNLYTDLQQYNAAETAFRRALALDPDNHHAAKRLAYVLQKSGRLAEAIPILAALVRQYPKDAVAQHLLAAYRNEDVPLRASDPYIKQTFDDYSADFDQALAQLQYKVPQLISAQVLNLTAKQGGPVEILDIGCGTGLCATYLKPQADLLVGVDLSGKMLAKAAQRQLYNELHEAELCDFMQKTAARFNFVICADTLVYFGMLQAVFAAVAGVLKPAGFFIFSVEQHRKGSGEGAYQLQVNGRYCHDTGYVTDTLLSAGFAVSLLEDIVPRLESGKEVDGALFVAQKLPG